MTYKTESVPTNTLKVGDLIIAHGGLFRVFEVIQPEHMVTEAGGKCSVNRCEFLGDADPAYPCSIPVSWRNGASDECNPGRTNHWNQQGNGLGRTARVIE